MRAKPIRLLTTFNFPGRRLDGELTILPSCGQDSHPLHGHVYIGDDALPFVGRVENLRIDAPDAKTGRKPKLERDIGAYIAYESIYRRAKVEIGERKGSAFATSQCLALWEKWPGIQEARALRRARKNARDILSSSAHSLFTYTGTDPDMSDYVACLLLAGASVQITAGHLTGSGPAWVWRWGEQVAEHHANVRLTAQVPEARPFTWTVN